MAPAKHVNYKTPFYVRTKTPQMSFVDHETKINVYGENIVKIDAPVGRKTMEWLRKGGLVKVEDADVKQAQKDGKEMEENAFKSTTKIVMKPSKVKGGFATPIEVEKTEEELEREQNLLDAADQGELPQDHTHSEDDHSEEVDGAQPGFVKTGARK